MLEVLSKCMWVLLVLSLFHCTAEKITYFSIEHPVVIYCNQKFMRNFNMSSRRRGRSDPVYYFEVNFEAVITMNNSVAYDFYFYEFLTNQYKRSFVEMHFKMCNMIQDDTFFGSAFRSAGIKCPYPPGQYHLRNMTIPTSAIPRSFPFHKGRIECNMTFIPTKELIFSGYADMELKTMKIRTKI